MHGETLPEDATMPAAVHGQLDRQVRRRATKRADPPKTPGQVAYEAWAKSGGEYRPWAAVQRFEAEVRDWDCAAAAVMQLAAPALEKLRASLVKIGAHPHSFWETADDVALIDALLACTKAPNVF